MTPTTAIQKHWRASKCLTIGWLCLALCGSSLAARAQDNGAGSMPPPAPRQDSQAPAQQDAPPQMPPNQAIPPQMLTLPAGTTVRVRVDEWVSTDRNLAGDSFSATLDQPIVVDGWVVARRGQAQTGRVSIVKKAGRVTGTSQLGVDLPELTLVDGQQLPLQTELLQTSAGTSHGQDAAVIGTTSGVGAAIGAAADGGAGAAIGLGAGAAAGIIAVLVTRGKPTEIPPETVLSFRLQAPVTISTEKSQFAFLPVTQSDYDSHPSGSRPHMQRPVPPPYYPYPFPYGYPYPFAFGIYGGYSRFGGYRH